MTAQFAHAGPWTEEDYLALGETNDRVELFDGSLHVTPAPTPRHQTVAKRLVIRMDPPTEAAGLQLLETLNVRLRPGRIPIPDLVITTVDIDPDDPIVPAAAVRLVCEILSPSNASTDKVLKMHYYAAAGIPWYLLVEQDTGTLHLYRLDGERYVEHQVARAGEVLRMSEPIDVEIAPAELLPGG